MHSLLGCANGSRYSFGFARFLAALAVVVSHHFYLSGRPQPTFRYQRSGTPARKLIRQKK
jgi:hypothetical protein